MVECKGAGVRRMCLFSIPLREHSRRSRNPAEDRGGRCVAAASQSDRTSARLRCPRLIEGTARGTPRNVLGRNVDDHTNQEIRHDYSGCRVA